VPVPIEHIACAKPAVPRLFLIPWAHARVREFDESRRELAHGRRGHELCSCYEAKRSMLPRRSEAKGGFPYGSPKKNRSTYVLLFFFGDALRARSHRAQSSPSSPSPSQKFFIISAYQ